MFDKVYGGVYNCNEKFSGGKEMKSNIKKIFFVMAFAIVSLVCFAFSATALEETGSCGENMTWNYDSITKELVISGEGEMYEGEHLPFYGSDIESLVINEGVTAISEYAFSYCEHLESVTVPDSVASIGGYAFYNSAYFKNAANWENGALYIGNHLIRVNDTASYAVKLGTKTIADSAFENCTNLKSVTVPDGVVTIGVSAFYDCKSLVTVDIPDSVTYIGNSAFYDCYRLESITLPDGVKEIGDQTFFKCYDLKSINIPKSAVRIGTSAFQDCISLQEAIIPQGVKSINALAFSGCYDLMNVSIAGTVESVGEAAFFGCERLESVTVADGVKSIGESAFYYCYNLTRIIIPDSVTSIGNDAFDPNSEICIYCNKNSVAATYAKKNMLDCIYLDGTDRESIVSGAEENFAWRLDKRTGEFEITGSGVIPDFTGVPAPWSEYSYCITSVVIPEGITKIGSCAFSGCSGLSSIVIPDSVTTIGDEAFFGCNKIENLTIGKNLKRVGNMAFFSDGEEDIIDSRIKNLFIPDTDILFNIEFVYDEDVSYRNNLLAGVENLFVGNEKVTEIVVPDSVTAIGDYRFKGSEWLESIIIPGSVKAIGEEAFYNCENLRSITLGDGLTTIGKYAFQYCENLASITIPHTVTEIGFFAFGFCVNLESITFALDEENRSSLTAMPDLCNTKIKNLVLPASIEIIASDFMPGVIEKVTVFNPDCEISSSCGLGYSHTIVGFRGSTAEAFAKESGAKFTDIETVHTHEFKPVSWEGYCFAESCWCGKVIYTPHSYSSSVTLQPTCITEGIRTFVCSCGDSYTEAVAVTDDHIEVADQAIPATCTELGLTEGSHCSACGTVIKRQTAVARKAHTVVIDEAIPATCTEPGLTEGSHCSVCETVIKRQTAAERKAHTVVIDEAIPATCTEPGLTEGSHCSACGTVIKRQTAVARKAHTVVIDEAIPATCTEPGLTEGSHCSVCETVIKRQILAAKKPHSEKSLTTKATFSGDGKIESKCSVCGYISKITVISRPVTVTLSDTVYTYNGKVKNPAVTVKDSKGKALKKDVDYVVSYSGKRKSVGTYTVTVTFKGKYSGTKKLSFDIVPAKVAISKLTAGKSQFTAAWKAVSDVTGYEIEYSTSSKFTVKTTKKAKIKKAKTAKITLKKLTKGKKYYVRIRAYKTVNGKVLYGAWSTAKSVKVK